MTPLQPNRTVGEYLAERPSRARICDDFGIDCCCGARLPLSLVCARQGLDPRDVLGALEADDCRGTPDTLASISPRRRQLGTGAEA